MFLISEKAYILPWRKDTKEYIPISGLRPLVTVDSTHVCFIK